MITRLYRYTSAILCLILGACSTTMNPYRPSFVEMARQAEYGNADEFSDKKTGAGSNSATGSNKPSTSRGESAETNRYARLNFSDQLALNYANEMANILRPKFNRARLVRETSATAQVAMAGVAGAAGPFSLSDSTLAVLGLGSAGLPELQRIFNAKGRAENYQVAVNMIEDAVTEYLAFNQSPSDRVLTQNGVSVVHRTNAAIHIVEQSLAGMLPTVQQMQQATERMSAIGAKETPVARGDSSKLAANNVPANPISSVEPPLPDKTPAESMTEAEVLNLATIAIEKHKPDETRAFIFRAQDEAGGNFKIKDFMDAPAHKAPTAFARNRTGFSNWIKSVTDQTLLDSILTELKGLKQP